MLWQDLRSGSRDRLEQVVAAWGQGVVAGGRQFHGRPRLTTTRNAEVGLRIVRGAVGYRNGLRALGQNSEPAKSNANCRDHRSSVDWCSRRRLDVSTSRSDRSTKMRLGIITFRLAALIVLITSASDYWAYDQWDPTAPMNSSGPEAIAIFASNTPSAVSLHCANLPDDHCLCCSPSVAPPAPVLPQAGFGSSADGLIYSIRPTGSKTLSLRASLPSRDPTGFQRPPRV